MQDQEYDEIGRSQVPALSPFEKSIMKIKAQTEISEADNQHFLIIILNDQKTGFPVETRNN